MTTDETQQPGPSVALGAVGSFWVAQTSPFALARVNNTQSVPCVELPGPDGRSKATGRRTAADGWTVLGKRGLPMGNSTAGAPGKDPSAAGGVPPATGPSGGNGCTCSPPHFILVPYSLPEDGAPPIPPFLSGIGTVGD